MEYHPGIVEGLEAKYFGLDLRNLARWPQSKSDAWVHHAMQTTTSFFATMITSFARENLPRSTMTTPSVHTASPTDERQDGAHGSMSANKCGLWVNASNEFKRETRIVFVASLCSTPRPSLPRLIDERETVSVSHGSWSRLLWALGLVGHWMPVHELPVEGKNPPIILPSSQGVDECLSESAPGDGRAGAQSWRVFGLLTIAAVSS